MDTRLVAWARAVKSRSRRCRRAAPPLWLFTDEARMAELLTVIGRLPKGLCGVVFRHDGVADRAQLAVEVWRICRDRRVVMVVAGRKVGPARAGLHCRQGRCGVAGRTGAVSTASAHGLTDLVRAGRARIDAAFLSPVFATASHAGAPSLGVVRWAGIARRVRRPAVLALGGIDGASVRRLPRWAVGAGAIGAFLDGRPDN